MNAALNGGCLLENIVASDCLTVYSQPVDEDEEKNCNDAHLPPLNANEK